MPDDRYCRACGCALSILQRCPMGCDAGEVDEPVRHLHLVEDDEPPQDANDGTEEQS